MQDKLKQIAENSVALHNKCVQNHFTSTVTGDGTTLLSFQVPFQADTLTVLCTDPRCYSQGNFVVMMQIDRMAMSVVASSAIVTRNGLVSTSYINAANLDFCFIQDEDGLVTIAAPSTTYCFAQDLPYFVTAVKYTDKTLKERYIELVEDLTGSGTIPVCSARIYSVFTQEEWAALIATKPDWTFKEI